MINQRNKNEKNKSDNGYFTAYRRRTGGGA